MTKQLHPTLKKCACGYIATKRELYKHFEDTRRTIKALGEPAREFFAAHGEVPLNVDAEELDLETSLKLSLSHIAGHRLDDNNLQFPVKP